MGLIENSNQIKIEMQLYIPSMMNHLKFNVGLIDFLKEMYDNNKTMLFHESDVFQLIKQICETI